MLAGLALCIGQPHGVRSQGLNTSINEAGIRHAIIASIELAQRNATAKRDAEPQNASINIKIRVMSFASDYGFFGVVDGKFSDFDPDSGAEAREIWAEDKCHQDRGLPKIWVLAITGKITRDGQTLDITARPRQVGVSVPQDEIVTQKDRNVELNDPNQNLVTVARTTGSGLSVRLDLKSAKCRVN
jgi:hypothetical protein